MKKNNNRRKEHIRRLAAYFAAAFLIAGSILPAVPSKAFAAEAPTADTGAAAGVAATVNAGTGTASGDAATVSATTVSNPAAADATAIAQALAAAQANLNAQAATAAQSTQTTAPAASSATVSGASVSTGNAVNTQSADAVPAIPVIYAVKNVSGSVALTPEEAVDESSVSEHLEENLKATVDAATGTAITTEEWEKVLATVEWEEAPTGYDSSNTEDYTFTWSGTIKAGTVVYADATKLKAAAVAADIPVVVTYSVSKTEASVSESRAPQTGDEFNPGLWTYFLIIGIVVALCSFILYRDIHDTH